MMDEPFRVLITSAEMTFRDEDVGVFFEEESAPPYAGDPRPEEPLRMATEIGLSCLRLDRIVPTGGTLITSIAPVDRASVAFFWPPCAGGPGSYRGAGASVFGRSFWPAYQMERRWDIVFRAPSIYRIDFDAGAQGLCRRLLMGTAARAVVARCADSLGNESLVEFEWDHDRQHPACHRGHNVFPAATGGPYCG